jgi:hypothetical protein
MPRPLCEFCREPMVRNGSNLADTYGGFYCNCGIRVTTRDGGKTWTGEKNEPVTVTLLPVASDGST